MSGVGSLIKDGLALAGFGAGGCDCNGVAKEWDNAGVDWCEQNKATILKHLRKQAEARNYPFPEEVVSMAVNKAIALAREEEVYQDMDYEHRVIAAIQSFHRPPEVRPKGWEWREENQDAMKRYMEAQNAYPWDYPGGHDGRGIVLVGGGKYFAGGWMCCKMLRDLGCELPIEWWYLDSYELDHYQMGLMRELGVEPVRLSDRTDRQPRILGGWEYKIWAIMYSRFREALYLDADQVPAANPETLFFDAEYREHGLRLWPDLTNEHGYDVTDQAFRICGLPIPDGRRLPDGAKHNKSTGYRPIESGQILVDKSRCWRTLEMVRTLNDQSDFFYRSPRGGNTWYIYGDKSTWLLAAGMTGQQYAMGKDCEYFGDHANGGGFTQYWGEIPILQHRCNPAQKIRVTGKCDARGIIEAEKFQKAFEELKGKWNGRIWRWQDMGPDDHAVAKEQIGDWVAEGLPRITQLKDGGQTNIGRYTWRILHDDGKPLLVLVDEMRALEFFGFDRNSWVRHDKGAFLYQAPPGWFSCDRNKFDLMVWSETTNNEYRLPDSLEGKTVLDLGGHVGMFAYSCFIRGAKRVVSVEPWPSSLAYLAANAKHMPCVETIGVAVGWEPGFHRMTAHADSQIGIFSDKGALAATVPLDDLLREIGPVDLLKLDIEGAEWPVLFLNWDWRGIPTIVGEYHLAEIDWWESKHGAAVPYSLENLRAILTEAGYSVEIDDRGLTGGFWAKLGERLLR